MSRSIDYFFTLASPWAYLGHGVFMDIVKRHSLDVDYRPALFANVFAETGGLPLLKRPPVRQRYRYVELQRWREMRGIALNLRPKGVPFDASLADRVVLAIVDAGNDPERYLRVAHQGVWEKELNLADEAMLGRVLREAGADPARTILAAKSEKIQARYDQNVRDAIAADVFGAPSYVLDGEVFWGQDRLELLDQALKSGRAPYRPTA
jgi:2-hydroxychromene-2-carboxylate isomerase